MSVLLRAVECCRVLECVGVCLSVLECVGVCCSVLQCVAVCCSVLRCVAACCSALQCVAVCCSVLQCVAVCCSVLQCVAVCCGAFTFRIGARHKIESVPIKLTRSTRLLQQPSALGRLHYKYNIRSLLQKSPSKIGFFVKRDFLEGLRIDATLECLGHLHCR